MIDHSYRGTPVSKMHIQDIYDILRGGACYADGDPTVGVSDEDWFWLSMRLEIELVRRKLGLPCR